MATLEELLRQLEITLWDELCIIIADNSKSEIAKKLKAQSWAEVYVDLKDLVYKRDITRSVRG